MKYFTTTTQIVVWLLKLTNAGSLKVSLHSLIPLHRLTAFSLILNAVPKSRNEKYLHAGASGGISEPQTDRLSKPVNKSLILNFTPYYYIVYVNS